MLVLATLALPPPSSAQGPIAACCGTSIYTNTFQSGSAGAGWTASNGTPTVQKTPLPGPAPGRRFLGLYGRTVNDQTVTFNSSTASLTLPTHTQLLVSFDLYIVRSWDGDTNSPPNCGSCPGPDHFLVKEGSISRTIFDATFDNYDYNRVVGPSGIAGSQLLADQSFPSPHLNPSNWPGQGAAEINTLGYKFGPDSLYPTAGGTIMDSVYHITLPIDHTGPNLILTFTSLGLQAIADEAWGIDNFCISVPDATSFGSEFETDITTWMKGSPGETWTLGGGSLTNPFSPNSVVIRNVSMYFGDPATAVGTVSSGSFEAAFRRTGGVDCGSCPSSIWIRGAPEVGPNYKSNGWWPRGYMFQINPNGEFRIIKAKPNAPFVVLYDSTTDAGGDPTLRTNANGVSESIIHSQDGAQNVLRVDFNLSAVKAYINGVLVYDTCDFDTEYQSGKVGVSLERNKTDFPPTFSIDYARLCTTTLPCGHGHDDNGGGDAKTGELD
jgi:hypothetical protein